MTDQSRPSAADIEDGIRNELTKLCRPDYPDFQCAGLILYLKDPFTASLEPVFMVPEKPYELRAAVRLDTADENSLAKVAYDSPTGEPLFSNDPDEDPRVGATARQIRVAYDIEGAMILVPLEHLPGKRRLGVLLAHAPKIRHGQEDPIAAGAALRAGAQRLNTLLLDWEKNRTAETARNYAQLTLDIFGELRPIRTPERAAGRFAESCSEYLRADYHLIQIRFRAPGPPQPRLVTNLHGDVGAVLAELEQHLQTADRPLVLNREQRDGPFFGLVKPFAPGKSCVWVGLRAQDELAEITCLLGREVKAIADHWSPGDVDFLDRSVRVFQHVVKRSGDFDRLLTQADHDGSERWEFDFFCHLFREFFNIDQVMVTRLKRERTQYRIVGVPDKTRGFVCDLARMTSRPLPMPIAPGRCDILPYILRRFLAETAAGPTATQPQRLYVAEVEKESPHFFLDSEVLNHCHLKGKVYYLLCISCDGNGPPILRGILHLGNSQGELDLAEEIHPYLCTFGDRIAERLAAEEQREMDEHLRAIRDITAPRQDLLQGLVRHVRDGCQSLGCTLFLRAAMLPLIGWHAVRPEDIENALGFFLSQYEGKGWPGVPDKQGACIRAMLAAFLGVTENEVATLLGQSGTGRELSRLLLPATYVRVAQTEAPTDEPAAAVLSAQPTTQISEPLTEKRLQRLVGNDPDAEKLTRLRNVALFLTRDCYLPGYGLTGWVLRYRLPLRLADKQAGTINACFQNFRVEPPRPALRKVAEFIEDHSLSSGLAQSAAARPGHKDHIKEVEGYSDQHDPYLAYPLDPIDEPFLASGVIRVSSRDSLRRSFDPQEEALVNTAARHVFRLLLVQYLNQQNWRRARDQRALDAGRDHDRKHWHEQIEIIQKCLTLLPVGTEQLAEDLDKLIDLCYQAVRQLDATLLIQRLSLSHDAADVTELIARELPGWLNSRIQAHHTIRVMRDPETARVPQDDALSLVQLCLNVEELVNNSRQHGQGKHGLVVLVGEQQSRLTIQVIEGASTTPAQLVAVPSPNLRPYSELLRQGTSGGGSRFLEKNSDEFTVSFWCLDNLCKAYQITCHPPTPSERGGPHVENEGAVRGQRDRAYPKG